jgi:hypothetical protein
MKNTLAAHLAVDSLTLTEAREFLHKLIDKVSEQEERIGKQEERIRELEERLDQNSGNSSKPPSSDLPARVSKSRKRPVSDKKRGAQPGHKGHRRQSHPHDSRLTVEKHRPSDVCSCCGGKVVVNTRPYHTHQVFDLPEVSYFVTEHQLYTGHCTHCPASHRAELPDTISNTQMGTNLLACIALQAGQFHQSISKIRQQLKQNFGLEFSCGAISEAQGRVSAMLTPTHQAIKYHVQQSDYVNADETRHQQGSHRRWMWLATTKLATFFMAAFGRGQEYGKKLLDADARGVLITDQYAGYRFYPETQRQLCWAHVLRNVTAIAESGNHFNQHIGSRLSLVANSVFRCRHRWENGQISHEQYHRRLTRYRQRWKDYLSKGAIVCSKGYRGRCRHLLKDDEMLWHFMRDDQIPLTNNEAERALRGYVLWRKGSYGVQSHRGELFRQRILSLVETSKRLQRCPLEWLRAVICACIEKTDYPIPVELVLSTDSG